MSVFRGQARDAPASRTLPNGRPVTVDACAALVARGDPDRFAAVMAAPRAARAPLLVLYAWNLEVARAPWASAEPLIAEMRLQWWRDLPESPRRAHEVAGPLHDLIRDRALPVAVMDALVAARGWDIGRAPHADEAALDAYLEATGGGLMWLAARALGAPDGAEAGVRAFGRAAGLAAYLVAVPALEARGRIPLVDGRPAAVAALARRGLGWIADARGLRAGSGTPALLAGWQAAPLLRRAATDPARVAEGRLALPEILRRGRLLAAALTERP
jgi:phytoene/squalene synthetase